MSNNATWDVRGESAATLAAVMSLAFPQPTAFTAWREYPADTINLDYGGDKLSVPALCATSYLGNGDGWTLFPSKAGVETVALLASEWLDSVNYSPKPDIDGDSKKGWRFLIGPAWTHFGPHHGAFGVMPSWQMYGK